MDKQTYQIQYTDNSYRMVDWTQDEFDMVASCILADNNAVVLKDGVFLLRDVRAIVLIPPMEEEPEQEENDLTDWGFVDQQTAEWLRAQGIEVGRNNK